MAEERIMQRVDVMVLINDMALYIEENKCSLDEACKAIGVPEEQIGIIEMLEILDELGYF